MKEGEKQVKVENRIEIPLIDDFIGIKQITKEIKVIIEEIDFIDNLDKGGLLDLCSDALHFLESQQPKLFVMYVAHTFRELTEKFFGEAKTIDNETYYDFSSSISEELLSCLDISASFGFIDSRDGHKIKLRRLINIEERNGLLRLSTDDIWHRNVWDLNNRYANNDNSKRDLGTLQFYKSIPVKYSLSSWTYEGLIKSRKALYKKLSGYAHGGKLKEIVGVLEKKSDERSDVDKEIIGKYIEVNMSVIDIFRPFESTTNEKIKQIDTLLND